MEGIDNILDRYQNRNQDLWSPFKYCFVGAMANTLRETLFGLYANGYKHSSRYLIEVSGEKLVQIIATYEANMAMLNSDQQKAVMDMATQRYLDALDKQVHDAQMVIEQDKIDATNLEFDTKFDALAQDQLAIQTLQEKLSQAIDKANADIQILEAQIAEETLNRQYVEVDILQKQLDVARANLRILEAGNKTLQLQLDIANAAVDEANLRLEKQDAQQRLDLVPGDLVELQAQGVTLDAEKKHTQTAESMVDSDIAEIHVRVSKEQLDVTNRAVDTALLDVDIAKAKLDAAMVDVEISETQSKTARERAQTVEYETEIAMVDVKIAQLELDADKVQAQLKEIEADIARFEANSMKKAIALIEQQIDQVRYNTFAYEIPLKKSMQIRAIEVQIDILKKKIEATEAYQSLEDDEFASRLTKQQTEQSFRMAMAELDISYDLHKAAMKIVDYSKDVLIASEQQKYQEEEDTQNIRIPASQIKATDITEDMALKAAEIMAVANISNTMRHIIGAS